MTSKCGALYSTLCDNCGILCNNCYNLFDCCSKSCNQCCSCISVSCDNCSTCCGMCCNTFRNCEPCDCLYCTDYCCENHNEWCRNNCYFCLCCYFGPRNKYYKSTNQSIVKQSTVVPTVRRIDNEPINDEFSSKKLPKMP